MSSPVKTTRWGVLVFKVVVLIGPGVLSFFMIKDYKKGRDSAADKNAYKEDHAKQWNNAIGIGIGQLVIWFLFFLYVRRSGKSSVSPEQSVIGNQSVIETKSDFPTIVYVPKKLNEN